MNYICESCGSDLKYYDKVSRMVRTKNRKASIITIKRFKCPVCNCIHRNLPNNIFPYKQYDARIITGVIAQLVEHWSPKPGVGSSSLSTRAN